MLSSYGRTSLKSSLCFYVQRSNPTPAASTSTCTTTAIPSVSTPNRATRTVTRALTPPELDVFEEEAPLVLKNFLKDVEDRRATTEKGMRLKLDHEVGDWVRTHYEVVSERFPGMLELTDDILIVTFPMLMHQFLVVVINDAIINAKLYREVYIKENIDYPLQGGGSKNLDCAIFAQNPEKDLKDLWPRFIFKIAFADSGRKCLRDLLKSLLCIRHKMLIGGGLAIKVFRNAKGEITKVVWHLVSFILDATQQLTSTKHRDMEPFQLYTKLPHPPNVKGKSIQSEGEQADIGDDVKANVGTKFQTYHDTNSLGARYYTDAVLIDAGVIDKNSLSPEYDVILNSNFLVGPDRKPLCLPAKAIWVEAMSKILKSMADAAWHKVPIPEGFNIDSLKNASAQKYGQHIKILVLIRAMDIACKFVHVPSHGFYPKFSKPLELDTRTKNFLNRLDKWPDKLESMRLNLRMSDETNLVPLPPLTPNVTPTDNIIHGDICILAAHWKHDSMKQWVKLLSVLEGVVFHIHLLTHHGGIEKLALWKSFIHTNYDHPDIPRIVQDDDTMKRFIWQLGKWKQAFATAVVISPLILITGQGLGQTPSAAAALQVRGRILVPLDQRARIGNLSGKVRPLVTAYEEDEEEEENWFTHTVNRVQHKGIVGFQVRLAQENKDWLAKRKDITGYPDISLPRYRRLQALSVFTDHPMFPSPKRHYYECTDLDNKDLLPFPVADAATICPLLTYHVEFWGYCHYQETWPNLPVKPVMIHTIRTQDLVVSGALAVLVSDDQKGKSMFDLIEEERRQHEAKAVKELNSQWRRMLLEATLLSWNSAKPLSATNSKRARPISFVEEMFVASKRPKLEHDSTRSLRPIVLPLVYSTAAKKLEEDDRATIEGWNKCIVANEDDTPRWYNPNRVRDSMICVLDWDTDAPLWIPWSWSLSSLTRVGDLDAPWEVQDHQRQTDPEKRDDINVAMSFRELFSEGQGVETIPYLTFSVHRTAFDQTKDLPRDLFPQEFPKWAMTWSLVSTHGAITYIHSDSQGVGTAIRVLTGQKLWYIFRRIYTKPNDSRTDEYLQEWEPGFIPDPKDWDTEVVLLELGTIFFMCPDTHHVVITIENPIVVGEHFYACPTLSRSVAGYVHTAMLDFSITNILHLELRPLLLRMMCYFSQNIRSKNTLASDIPNIYCREGFLDLIALGNLCLFASVLNVNPKEGKHAVMVAVTAYKALLQWASRNLSLIMWGKVEGTSESDEEEEGTLESDEQDILLCIDPADFSRNSVAHFARSLILYALKVKDERQDDIFLLDIGELRKMWNSIEFTDFDSEHEEEDNDDDQDEESTINVSNTDVMNTDVNLGGGEASFALIPASGISEALTVNMSDNAVMDVDEAEALLSSIPVISMSQQSALKVNNPNAMDCDNKMGVGTAKVEGIDPTYEKLYSSDPWTIEELLPVDVTKTFLGVVPHHIGNDYWVILMINIHDKRIYLLDGVKHDGWQKQHGDIMKSYGVMFDKSADSKKSGSIGLLILYIEDEAYFHHTDHYKVPKYSSIDSSVFCALFAWLLITQTILPATDAPFWKSNIAGAAFRLELIHFLKHINTMP
ncbi:hypothetical protein ARMGADRAFT_1086784 [Armillaria gallica]|uniref:Uncharacterized protein n=1 Tax=Armillaria gallica TaxID=47427 RepID=A0A2H3DDI4_ARMGA|nr:hypothetical protein ARMGADRAFT_1086784 [Armillaria gallica]